MHDFEDPADLDGDGSFDAIDMMILEDGDQDKRSSSGGGNSGCCVVLLGVGASVGVGWWLVGSYLV